MKLKFYRLSIIMVIGFLWINIYEATTATSVKLINPEEQKEKNTFEMKQNENVRSETEERKIDRKSIMKFIKENFIDNDDSNEVQKTNETIYPKLMKKFSLSEEQAHAFFDDYLTEHTKYVAFYEGQKVTRYNHQKEKNEQGTVVQVQPSFQVLLDESCLKRVWDFCESISKYKIKHFEKFITLVLIGSIIGMVVFFLNNTPLFLWKKSSLPMFWDAMAIITMSVSTLIIVLLSTTKSKIFFRSQNESAREFFDENIPTLKKFFTIDISEYLALIWQFSIPGYIVSAIFKYFGTYYRYSMQIAGESNEIQPLEGNQIMLIFNYVSITGLGALTIFPLDYYYIAKIQLQIWPKISYWRDFNTIVHGISAAICFWTFALWQSIQTISLIINIWWHQLPGLYNNLAFIISSHLLILNVITIICLNKWGPPGNSKYEWIAATTIGIYLLLSNVLVMNINPYGEDN